ncbi:MAG TPA: N-acetylmuramoyl-L-alanine amidase [Sulfuricurvum kujiense]|uniref:N-acetylmuramoyl-L-alanine amidase n=1 Tax=Sulfuricurvum kujiense TaxID=148813 RepID=A0A2D3WBT4_9BACT|nr:MULTISPECIES: N-acetylmuramoyl-L-alanine amidase [Sulfuricurvum]DAB38772.1 MAG TPA: N-acetylmuramoyl-L-alanine amidase [Sulfuricurvum kujiense]
MSFTLLNRFFFLAIVCFTSLMGAIDTDRLESAKKALASNDEIEQFRGYNEFKTLYLRAILDKDAPVALEALEGIVQGGEKLGIDVRKYQTDLAKLKKNTPSAKPLMVTEKTPTSPLPSVIYDKTFKPALVASKFSTPEPEKMIKSDPILPKNEITMTMRHRLLDTSWKDNGLILVFDSEIKPSEVRMSKILETDKKRFRYIMDIDSSTLSKTQTLEHQSINRIIMAQFDAKTLRVVIEHNQPISIKTTPKGSTLYIDLSLEPPKTTPPLATAPVKEEVQEPLQLSALPPLVTVTPRDRSKKIIVIDPGHGGKDSGAVGNGFMEKEIVLGISKQLSEKLRAMGYTVYMTRSNDVFIELKDRTKFANDKEADLFVSVHANSIPKTSDPLAAQGLETYFLSPTRSERSMRVAALENSEDMEEMGEYGKLSFLSFLNKEKIIASNKLAIDLQKGMFSNLRKQFPNVHDNGVREAPFWVLVGAQMPAVLLEVGYISHPEESTRIADEKYQRWLVEGLMEGIGRYFANNS